MTYLLAKFALLFVLATLLGFFLGYWWSRRNFVDVTESFEELKKATSRSDTKDWDRLWARLDALPEAKETDLSSVYTRLDGVAKAVSTIPRPEPVSFEPVESRLESLDSGLWALSEALGQKDATLKPVMERLDGVAKAVSSMPRPEPVSFEPVESRLESLDSGLRALSEALGQKDAALKAVMERLDGVAKAVSSMPRPEPVRLESVESRLDALDNDLRALPEALSPKGPDLQPVTERIDRLESAIKAMPAPDKPQPVDLGPVTAKLTRLEGALRDMPRPQPAREVDLAPVQNELTSLRRALDAAAASRQSGDLRPVTTRLGALEETVRAMPRPQTVDLEPLDGRLKAIESEVQALGKRLAAAPTAARPSAGPARSEPRILKAALYGKKDDLKLISGVGPKLERLLNDNGVYYFWQVASWTPGDVDIIDERLDVFRGRITRDDWVSQARNLSRRPDAARMPSE